MSDLPLDQLDAALTRCAVGVHPHEAAVRLITERGEWPAQLAHTVDLSDAISGLDRTDLTLVLAALSHANGSQEHRKYIAAPATRGGPPFVGPDTRRVELGPVFAWSDNSTQSEGAR